VKVTAKELKNQLLLVRQHWAVNEVSFDAMQRLGRICPASPLSQAFWYAPGAVDPILAAGLSAADLNEPPGRFRSWRGPTPLMAALQKDPVRVPVLIGLGADAGVMTRNEGVLDQLTPANVHHLPLLLASGASFDHFPQLGPAPFAEVAWRHPGLVPVLLAHGANVNQIHAWGTALGLAALRHQLEAVKTLLAHGADPNLPSPYNGKTPLMHAMHPWFDDGEAEHCIRLLLASGADPDAVDDSGRNVTNRDSTPARRAFFKEEARFHRESNALARILPAAPPAPVRTRL
jgi:hypothetical protein